MTTTKLFKTVLPFLAILLIAAPAIAQLPDIEIGDDELDDIGLPINPYFSYSYSQSIFLQEEIDIEGKRIQKIAYYYDGGRQWSDHISVYMAHTDVDEIFGFQTEGLTLVYEGFWPVMNEEGWAEIPLMFPFEYNNEDNLLIAIKENTPGFRLNSKFYSSAVSSSMSVLAVKDISPPYDVNNPPTEYSILNYRPNIRFWFEDIPDGPAIAVIPSQLHFQYIRENEEKTINVDIYNTGISDLDISGFDAGDLPFSSTFEGIIPVGGHQNVSIKFSPDAVGSYNGFGGFTGNIPDNLFQIHMDGKAVHELSIIETFQELTFPPDEWYVDENSWNRRGFGGYIGGGNARLQHPGQPGRLVTPKINIQEGDQLVFYAMEFQEGSLTVSYSPDQETWTELASLALTRAFQPYIIDLDDAQGANYIGFSGIPQVYLDYVITPPVLQENPPDPSLNPNPADGFEDAFLTQHLRWGASVFAAGYKVYLGTDDPPTNMVDGTDVGTARVFKTPPLDYGTTYYWRIVPYNDFGDAIDSPVWTFTTIDYNPVTAFPFTEDFEANSGQVPPDGWINQDGHWETTENSNSGQYAAKARWNVPVDAILITPPIQVPSDEELELTFYWQNGDIFGKGDRIIGHDSLYVEVSTDKGQNWHDGLFLSAESPMDNFLPVNLDLTDYSGEEIHIRFRHSTDANNQYAKTVAIDDIEVRVAEDAPIIWVSENSWDAGTIPNNTWLDSPQFTLRNLGSDELTITAATFSGDYFKTTLDPAEISLPFGEDHHFYFSFEPFEDGSFPNTFTIESNGGTAEIDLTGISSYVPPFDFEGFEDGIFPPHGWMVHDEDGDEITWMLGYGNAIPPHTGFHSAISFSYVWGIGDLTPDNWLVTPKISVGENQEFAFWVATEEYNYPYEHYKIYLSTTTNRLDQFNELLWEETLQPADTAFSERVFDLRPYEGMDVYIAFHHVEVTGQFLIKIDDVEIRDIQLPAMPYAIPEPGEVEPGTEVSLFTETEGALIYYSMDGSEPDSSDYLFEDPIVIETDTTIKAVAWFNDLYSETATLEYFVTTTGIKTIPTPEFHVFPNPARDLLYIQTQTAEPFLVRVKGTRGDLLIERKMTGSEMELDVSALKPGIYFIHMMGVDGNAHKSFIVH